VVRTRLYQEIQDHVSPNASFGPNRGHAAAGDGFPYDSGGEYGAPEEDRPDGKNPMALIHHQKNRKPR